MSRHNAGAGVLLSSVLLVACGANASEPAQDPDPTQALSEYFISVTLCDDAQGPDCTRLHLGDRELTTTQPAVGKLYSCQPGNPNAPGSVDSKITWIDNGAGTWNLLTKPFLPAGRFSPGPGSITMSDDGQTRTISITNLPADGQIGDWPLTQYPVLSEIDPNPGTPQATRYTFQLPMNPAVAESPSCSSLGPIGTTLNGVVLYNAVDARGEDAVAHEIVDVFGGHPAMSEYHYHFLPERLDVAPLADGHSGLVGYIADGFGLYGYRGVGGRELSNADLDVCHGHDHEPIGYHYHATIEYPYVIGCYRGTPALPQVASISAPDLALAGDQSMVGSAIELGFLIGMKAHHEQALEMTELAKRHATTDEVRAMAAQMDAVQSYEVQMMGRWLRGVPPNDLTSTDTHNAGTHVSMPGMLSPQQMASLRVARGLAFDLRFVELMIKHHQGAITMVDELFEQTGREHAQGMLNLADGIEALQNAEISAMQALAERLRSTLTAS